MMRQKRIHALAACVLLALSCLAMSVSALAQEDFFVVNNPNPKDRLNLRTQPRDGAPSLGRYYNGVVVIPLSEPTGGWVKVRVDGSSVVGYMQTRYLSYRNEAGVAAAVPKATVRNSAGKGLNLRDGRSTGAAILGFYANGAGVEVLGYGETWHHVLADGVVGYMQASGLKLAGGGGGTSSGGGTATVNNPDPTDRLNLRVSVGKDGKGASSLGKYYSGVQVEIIETLTRGGVAWAKVRIGNRVGYMQMAYLVEAGSTKKVTSAIPVVTVTSAKPGDRLNLRERPSDAAPSLGKYHAGTTVEVLGIVSDTWSHVRVDGQVGFMMNKFLTPRPKFAK